MTKLKKTLAEVALKRYELSFDAKIKVIAEMGHRFAPAVVSAVRDEEAALCDKYADIYQN